MKLLREYIRSLLTEAAKGPADLPENWYVKFWNPGGTISVELWEKLSGKREKKIGQVWADQPERKGDAGPCSGAWEVVESKAPGGWGPMLYDIAMEFVGSDGLMADRGTVSDDAYGIWAYYDNRGDIKAFQLDNLENDLTPTKQDNCMQAMAGISAMRVSTSIKHNPDGNFPKVPLKWYESPLSRRYVKSGSPTISALKSLGKWAEGETG